MTQTGAKVPTDTRNPKQRQGQRAPTAPMWDQPTFSTQTLVQISHEGSCIKRNHLNFSYWYRFPASALGFLSLWPQSMDESFHLLLPSREMALLPAKINFSSLLQTLFWVSTRWNVKLELFWRTLRSPRAVLYSDEVQSLREKNIPDANTLDCECEILPLWKSHGCWKCAAPTDFTANKLLLRNDSRKQKQGCKHIYLKRQTNGHVSLWSDLPSAA